MSDAAVEAITRTAEKLRELEAASRVLSNSYDDVTTGIQRDIYHAVAETYLDAWRILRENYP